MARSTTPARKFLTDLEGQARVSAVDADGREFEFEHDWAESFTLVRHAESTGLAHYECVRIR